MLKYIRAQWKGEEGGGNGKGGVGSLIVVAAPTTIRRAGNGGPSPRERPISYRGKEVEKPCSNNLELKERGKVVGDGKEGGEGEKITD